MPGPGTYLPLYLQSANSGSDHESSLQYTWNIADYRTYEYRMIDHEGFNADDVRREWDGW